MFIKDELVYFFKKSNIVINAWIKTLHVVVIFKIALKINYELERKTILE